MIRFIVDSSWFKPSKVRQSDEEQYKAKPVEVLHMTTREAKRTVRLREWGMMVKLCQESGLTVNEWCAQNHLKPACYYYRLSQVRKAILNHSSQVSSAAQEPGVPTLVKVNVASAEQYDV